MSDKIKLNVTMKFGNADDFQLMTEEEWDQSQDEGLALQQ